MQQDDRRRLPAPGLAVVSLSGSVSANGDVLQVASAHPQASLGSVTATVIDPDDWSHPLSQTTEPLQTVAG